MGVLRISSERVVLRISPFQISFAPSLETLFDSIRSNKAITQVEHLQTGIAFQVAPNALPTLHSKSVEPYVQLLQSAVLPQPFSQPLQSFVAQIIVCYLDFGLT